MKIIATVFAIASGILVLFGNFFPGPLDVFRLVLIEWAIVIAGMSVLVGVANLVWVHMQKVRMQNPNSAYSGLLVLALIFTFGLGFILPPNSSYLQLIMDAIIFPVEAALMAIMSVTLLYASIRLFRRRNDVMSVVFLVSSILVLFAYVPTGLGPLILYILNLFSSGGARGLLIGIALGTIFTGLRVLLGVDRPYGGN